MIFKQSMILLGFITFFVTSSFAQGIEFFHGTWKEALELAKEDDRLIFVDANTAWCGPCRRMAANVFTQEHVGDFYNGRFINMKIDMEKGDIDFRAKYSVSAYPTLLFINSAGEIIKKKVGGQRAEGLIKLGREALSLFDNVDEMDDLFAQGKDNASFLRKYVKALNNAGKPSAKAANQYLRAQKDLTTKENLLFIYNAVASADSRVFDLLIKHRAGIEAHKSKDEVNKLIKSACKKTVLTAIEFQDDNLLAEAKRKMKGNHPTAAKEFGYQADMKYFATLKEREKYLKVVKKYAKKVVKKDASKLNKLALDIYKTFPKDANALAFALSLAKKSAKTGGLWEYYFTYAQLLAEVKDYDKAIEIGEKAFEMAKAKNVSSGKIFQFLRSVKAKAKQ